MTVMEKGGAGKHLVPLGFAAVDADVWVASGRDPVRFLGLVSSERLQALSGDKKFLKRLQIAHAEWAEAKLAEPPLATARRRARQVAFTLLEQGDDADHVERVLFATGFHPSVCHDAARWAYQRHRDAMEAAAAAATPETAA